MSAKLEKGISKSAVWRLPRYFRYLRELLMNGIMRVSSQELAERLAITPSQVRSDLNKFDGVGQQGYGYNAKLLYTEISRELGVGDRMTAVIIGGDRAFIKRLSERFEGRGVTVIASFSETEEQAEAVPVYSFAALTEFLEKHHADIAVIVESPRGLLPEDLVSRGIKGMWNLTQTDITASVPVINLPVGDILMSLCYEIRKNAAEENE